MRRYFELSPGERDTATSQVLTYLCMEKEFPTLEEAEHAAEVAWYPAPDDAIVIIDPLDGIPQDEQCVEEECSNLDGKFQALLGEQANVLTAIPITHTVVPAEASKTVFVLSVNILTFRLHFRVSRN